MSYEGQRKVAAIFSQMQQLRIELLGGDKQDILLGQMLEKGKDAMKDTFLKATINPTYSPEAKADELQREKFWTGFRRRTRRNVARGATRRR